MTACRPIFSVSGEVFERWPGYVVGCVWARGINNGQPNGRVDALLSAAEAHVTAQFGTIDPKDMGAVAIWRSAFSGMGWTPSKYLSSVEAVVKRVARGNSLPRISPIVDAANAVSLRCVVPIGAHDVESLHGQPLQVRFALDDDRFAPMGDASLEQPDRGEIIYACGNVVRTRRWVWRQSRDALVRDSTRDVFFPIDGFHPETSEAVEAAAAMLAGICRDLLDAQVSTGIVSAAAPEFPLRS